MPIHSVEQLLSLKSQFTQKPFANFSLSNCIARKKQGERLERGTNAWGGRHAITVAEGRTRQIQHSLNKLSEEKYDEVLTELQKPEFFEPDTIKILVEIVYQKALAEPFLAAIYSNLCYSLARFEVQGDDTYLSPTSPSPSSSTGGGTGSNKISPSAESPSSLAAGININASSSAGSNNGATTSATPGSPIRPKSLFRATIVLQAQHEFEKSASEGRNSLSAMKQKCEMSVSEQAAAEEEAERILKRKRANIKFVGHLFLVNVLSIQIMRRIVDSLLRVRDTPMFCPSELDVDVLTVLLTTIGSRVESNTANPDADGRQFLDEIMTRLTTLEQQESSRYTMRVRTKIMNLTDLRQRNWAPRQPTSSASPLSNSSSSSNPVTPASSRTPYFNTPNVPGSMNKFPTPSGRFGGGGGSGSNSALGSGTVDPKSQQFPDTPSYSTSTPLSQGPTSFKAALMASKQQQQQQQQQTISSPFQQNERETPSSSSGGGGKNSGAPPPSYNQHREHSRSSGGSTSSSRGESPAVGGGGKNPAVPDRFARPPATATTTTSTTTATGKSADRGSSNTNKAETEKQPEKQTTEKQPEKQTVEKETVEKQPEKETTEKQTTEKETTEKETTEKTSTTATTATTTTSSSSASASTSSAPPPPLPPTKPIGTLIKDLYREWLSSHVTQKTWQQRFAGYNRTEEELRAAIVGELVWEACMTTRQDAQLEGVLFCREGLSFQHVDFYPGFKKILRKALHEGVITDVPKFFDRLMLAMHYAVHASHNSRTILYRQLVQLIFSVAESNPLDDDSPESNEDMCDELLRLWQSAPRDEAVEDSVVEFMLRPRQCATKFPEMVVEMLLFSVTEAKVLSAEPVKRWLASGDSKNSALKPLISKNF